MEIEELKKLTRSFDVQMKEKQEQIQKEIEKVKSEINAFQTLFTEHPMIEMIKQDVKDTAREVEYVKSLFRNMPGMDKLEQLEHRLRDHVTNEQFKHFLDELPNNYCTGEDKQKMRDNILKIEAALRNEYVNLDL